MATTRNKYADYATYLAVRLLVAGLQAFPLAWGEAFARALARIAYAVDKRHRNVAIDNLRLAFGDRYSEPQLKRLCLGVYEHFLRTIVEMARIPRAINQANWKKFVRLEGAPFAAPALLDETRPKVIATGHFGNWEMAGVLTSQIGIRTYAIARTLDNPYLHRFVSDFREARGQTLLSKNDDYDKILEVLANKGVLVSLADQSAGPRGYFVDFFGRPASTHKALALLAMEYDAPVMLCYGYRIGRELRYAIGCEAIYDPRDYKDAADGALRMTQDMSRGLEALVRRAPEQYLWLHNRWKHQPAKKRGAA
ncbi:MAG TPA: lipid A biosynthesis acyltransferase [Planctomycetia bacterium]|nr:lipid A biosynthesis acyltransferase [Planctomycetia bacterium]